jgi:23S rRNA (guanosine2251-2'-O)-methyltransferase
MTLYGFKALKENIKNIDHVDISNHKVNEIDFLKNNGIKYTIRAQSFFNNFKGINHQFVVSYTIKQKNNDLQSFLSKVNLDKKIIFVIVDSIMDPHNFGAILRTCEAFNVDGVIYKKDNQVQITDVVSKTSQGAADRLNLFRVTNLSNAIQILKENKF